MKYTLYTIKRVSAYFLSSGFDLEVFAVELGRHGAPHLQSQYNTNIETV